jgi:GDP-mannose transporter
MQLEVIAFGVAYAIFSSTLIVVNKWALSALPTPNFLLVLQSLATALLVYVITRFGGKQVRLVQKSVWKWFVACVVIQFLTILSNMFSLHYLGVDRVILLRIVAMLPIAMGDYLFNNRMMPSIQSWICFGCLCLANLFVFSNDSTNITPMGILAGLMYFVFISTDQVLLKTFTRVVEMPDSDRTIWVNLFAVPLSLGGILVTGETNRIVHPPKFPFFSHYVLVPFLISCILGAGISYTAWGLRSRSSAVTFSLIGIVCKVGSMALNFFFFDHLSAMSLILISLGIASTFYYEQAPLRPTDPNDVLEHEAPSPNAKPPSSKPTPTRTYNMKNIAQVSALCLTIFVLGISQVALREPVMNLPNNSTPTNTNNTNTSSTVYSSPLLSLAPVRPHRVLPSWIAKGTYSSHRCVGSVPGRDDAWRFRSCYFRNVCYYGNDNGTLLYFADPTSTANADALKTGTIAIYDHFTSGGRSTSVPYGPDIVKGSIEYYGVEIQWMNRDNPRKVVTAVTNWFLPEVWSHLLFDTIYPLYRLLDIFGLGDATIEPFYSETLCNGLNCHFRDKKQWIRLATRGEFIPQRLQEYHKEKHNSSLICWPHLITGVGLLSDHGLGESGHGRNVERPDWALWGQGSTMWDYRLWTMERAGIKNPASLMPEHGIRDVTFLRKGKRSANYKLDVDEHEHAVNRLFNDTGLNETYQATSAPNLETMDEREQMEFMATTKVLVSQSGSTSYAGYWLPPGATLILLTWNNDEYLDYSMWMNLGWITVKYFKPSQKHEVVQAVIEALAQYERYSQEPNPYQPI